MLVGIAFPNLRGIFFIHSQTQFWKSLKATVEVEAKLGKREKEENPDSPIVSCLLCAARAARCT
jgi:hypothetical protein